MATDDQTTEPVVEEVEAQPFDPADHTVAAVLEYLDGQHPDEVNRVLDLERAGKARTTLLDSQPAAEVEDLEPASVEERLGDANPYELVRARDAGATYEYTTTRIAALSAGATVLDKPPADQFGVPYPTKSVLDLQAEATPTDAAADGQPGSDTKEN